MPYNVDLPQFSGDEKEQLSQIRNFLYRQAEQLGYALNNIDSTIGDTYTPPKSQLNTSEIMKKFGDYVIESGTASGWSYKKWRGGTYEMHGIFEVKPTSSARSESLYITNAIAIPTPFDISADVVVGGTVSGNRWLVDSSFATMKALSVRIMSDSDISTSDTLFLRLHAVGTFRTDREGTTLSLQRNGNAYAINTEV